MSEAAWEWKDKQVNTWDVKEANLAQFITMNVDDNGEVQNYSHASDLSEEEERYIIHQEK